MTSEPSTSRMISLTLARGLGIALAVLVNGVAHVALERPSGRRPSAASTAPAPARVADRSPPRPFAPGCRRLRERFVQIGFDAALLVEHLLRCDRRTAPASRRSATARADRSAARRAADCGSLPARLALRCDCRLARLPRLPLIAALIAVGRLHVLQRLVDGLQCLRELLDAARSSRSRACPLALPPRDDGESPEACCCRFSSARRRRRSSASRRNCSCFQRCSGVRRSVLRSCASCSWRSASSLSLRITSSRSCCAFCVESCDSLSYWFFSRSISSSNISVKLRAVCEPSPPALLCCIETCTSRNADFGAQQLLQSLLLDRHGFGQLERHSDARRPDPSRRGASPGSRRTSGCARLRRATRGRACAEPACAPVARASPAAPRASSRCLRSCCCERALRSSLRCRFQVASRISRCRSEIAPCSSPMPPPSLLPPCACSEATLERLHLHHEQIGLHRRLAILRDRVVRDQIAGHEPLSADPSPARAELFQVAGATRRRCSSRRRPAARPAIRRRSPSSAATRRADGNRPRARMRTGTSSMLVARQSRPGLRISIVGFSSGTISIVYSSLSATNSLATRAPI